MQTEDLVNGIPNDIDIKKLIKWVEKRVSPKRFKHIKGVVKQGELISYHQNINPLPVALACWLHDSCKELKSKELIKLADENNIPLLEIEKKNGHILHGPVAAKVVSKKFSITNSDVLQAIAEHTLGGINMCTVSKVVYLADILEESRPASLTAPIWNALRGENVLEPKGEKVELNLDKAIYVASNLCLAHLIEADRPIHPKTVEVRNHFMEITKST